jgi:hypothetical protein
MEGHAADLVSERWMGWTEKQYQPLDGLDRKTVSTGQPARKAQTTYSLTPFDEGVVRSVSRYLAASPPQCTIRVLGNSHMTVAEVYDSRLRAYPLEKLQDDWGLLVTVGLATFNIHVKVPSDERESPFFWQLSQQPGRIW